MGCSAAQPLLLWCRQVLDSNGSGGLTSQEFCAAMKKLVRSLGARLRIRNLVLMNSFEELSFLRGMALPSSTDVPTQEHLSTSPHCFRMHSNQKHGSVIS